jgi:flagellar motor switch protein FliG
VTVATRVKSAAGLTGAQKCAVLCMALGPEGAGRILQQLGPEEVEAVTREIAALPTVPAEVVSAVLQEYQSASQSTGAGARGGMDYARQVLEQTMGSRARGVIDRIQEQTAGLPRLRRTAPEVLIGILRDEHPQTVALIVAHLDPEQAMPLIAAMESELAADVLTRVARMEKVSPEALSLVESALASRTDLGLTQDAAASGGPDAVAKVLNLAGPDLEKRLLESMQGHNPEVAADIKKRMFTFEDLLRVDGKGVQRLLREIETRELALALKAASDELKAHIHANMSGRAGEALDEEIEMMGPVRVRDVEAAHERIIEAVRSLEESGELIIRGQGGQSDVIG